MVCAAAPGVAAALVPEGGVRHVSAHSGTIPLLLLGAAVTGIAVGIGISAPVLRAHRGLRTWSNVFPSAAGAVAALMYAAILFRLLDT